MKAVIYTKQGTNQEAVLKIQDIAKPVPEDHQVLVKVKACSLNVNDYTRFTTTKSNGKMSFFAKMIDKVQQAPGKPIGGEIAGVVESIGKQVKNVKIGDEVFGVTLGSFPNGGLAEFAICSDDLVYQKPESLTFEASSALPISAITALGAVRKGKVEPGKKVLIYGSSGGVGQYAIQISKASGGIITGVCSTRNVEIAQKLGCSQTIDYKKADFTKCNDKFDVILGINGYNPLHVYRKLLKPNGIYVSVGGIKQGIMGGMFGGISSIGSSKKFTGASFAESVKQENALSTIKQLSDTGQVKPYIDKIYSVNDTVAAIQYIVKYHTHGKVVIKMDI
ncbi:NAD(P)-dependent alcohol dehydrogenase [Lactobacillus sp. ESL0681]|uniref:NAD(P)-dependent alcohol dehydrogenase n=1 Tax=Lactobacillus sp. ESL0681 TaxID=2983211 RepID=UPI0023F767A9|nr:NAD(P)-dependent alcohol dehydrogenase [Lactobacillus sp. ESL0681]WEV39779.1 NAD(P)-dependent alcohol dehydrogenase [Lactobacillus sp. ESL0681]